MKRVYIGKSFKVGDRFMRTETEPEEYINKIGVITRIIETETEKQLWHKGWLGEYNENAEESYSVADQVIKIK